MKFTKEYILAEIKRTAKENGGVALGRNKFKSETGITYDDWHGKYWTKWSDAVREAGCIPNKFQQPYKEEQLLEKLIELIVELDHFPTNSEIRYKAHNDQNFPSHNTFCRLGKKSDRAQKIIEYCKRNAGNDRLIEICMKVNQENTKRDSKVKMVREKEIIDFGCVYLMKSGKYYKVGKSKYPGRRQYELDRQSPEEVRLLHEIRTDDPDGIESYWHKRFESKRKKGEWFELTPQDVKDFKRRKIM